MQKVINKILLEMNAFDACCQAQAIGQVAQAQRTIAGYSVVIYIVFYTRVMYK
jgi:hypothetical protein